EVREGAGEQLGARAADVADPECDEEARERRGARALEAREQVLRGLLAHALELRERRRVEGEDVGEAAHEAALDELVDELLAEPLDVERSALREVAQVVLELRRAVEVRAARDGLALEAHRRGSADRARRAELPGRRAARAAAARR